MTRPDWYREEQVSPEEATTTMLTAFMGTIEDAAAQLELTVPVLLRYAVDATDTNRWQQGEKALQDIHAAVRVLRGLMHTTRQETAA